MRFSFLPALSLCPDPAGHSVKLPLCFSSQDPGKSISAHYFITGDAEVEFDTGRDLRIQTLHKLSASLHTEQDRASVPASVIREQQTPALRIG